MKEIKELVKSVKKYKNTVIQQELKSKKNTVAYVTIKDKPKVIKWFVPGLKRQMNIEYSILEKGSGKLNIPSVFDLDEENNVIIMNYINGENLCDLINDISVDYSEKVRLMKLLAEWFYNFHNFFKTNEGFIIRGDSNLRNFIFTDKINGVDFEESRIGQPVEDLARLCASVLSTNPMFEPDKFKLCRIFLETYTKLAPGRVLNANPEIAYALLENIQYRPEDEEILRKFSKKIREKGI